MAETRDELAPTAPVPVWLVLDAMAQAAVDSHWQPYSPHDAHEGMSPELWAEAKEGHFQALRDDMVEALDELEQKGWVVPLDWDAEPPEVVMVRAEDLIAARESGSGEADDGR